MSAHDELVDIIRGQFEAALAMLNQCIIECPDEHWDGLIAKYPFWHTAYHTLCFVDCYLSRSDEDFQTRPDLHPRGKSELEDEYPSRRFTRAELRHYVGICREKLRDVLRSETPVSMTGPSGFPWLKFTRAELHLYNLRHVQHHTGQLGAFLRRAGSEVGWVKSGWKD